ncbi:DUF6192 family protein [Streptomyces sp. NPDC055100]
MMPRQYVGNQVETSVSPRERIAAIRSLAQGSQVAAAVLRRPLRRGP